MRKTPISKKNTVKSSIFTQSPIVLVTSVSSILLSNAVQDMSKVDLNSIYKEIEPSVVHIVTRNKKLEKSIGSGFVYRNHIVTNAHVISDAVHITIDGNYTDLDSIELIDEGHDIALIKENTDDKKKNINGCTFKSEIGNNVLAFGSPFGLDKSMSKGVISGLDRTLDISEELKMNNLIQTDASVNPGNSGGPLIDIEKECVVGMNTAILSPTGVNAGVGFAIPIDNVDKLITIYDDYDELLLGSQ